MSGVVILATQSSVHLSFIMSVTISLSSTLASWTAGGLLHVTLSGSPIAQSVHLLFNFARDFSSYHPFHVESSPSKSDVVGTPRPLSSLVRLGS